MRFWKKLLRSSSSKILETAEEGDLKRVNALLEGNPDLVFSRNNDGKTPLHLAAKEGHKDLAALLLASNALEFLHLGLASKILLDRPT